MFKYVRVCAYVLICTLVFWRQVLSMWFTGLTKMVENDIQSSDIKRQRPVELWRIDRLREQRVHWLSCWKRWKREIDEADRRQAARGLQQSLFGV